MVLGGVWGGRDFLLFGLFSPLDGDHSNRRFLAEWSHFRLSDRIWTIPGSVDIYSARSTRYQNTSQYQNTVLIVVARLHDIIISEV